VIFGDFRARTRLHRQSKSAPNDLPETAFRVGDQPGRRPPVCFRFERCILTGGVRKLFVEPAVLNLQSDQRWSVRDVAWPREQYSSRCWWQCAVNHPSIEPRLHSFRVCVKAFKENLLRCVFNQIAFCRKKRCATWEHSRTIAPDYLSERRLVFSACLARQLRGRRLFVPIRQKRSSSEFTAGGPFMN